MPSRLLSSPDDPPRGARISESQSYPTETANSRFAKRSAGYSVGGIQAVPGSSSLTVLILSAITRGIARNPQRTSK